jgi:hypothetical protein
MRSRTEREEQRVKIFNSAMHQSLTPTLAIFEAIMELCRTIDDNGREIANAVDELTETMKNK